MPNLSPRSDGRRDGSVSAAVAVRVAAGGERFWKLSDFADLPAGAAVRALSRLTADGELRRVQRGVYWHGRATVLGPSIPAASGVMAATARSVLHPAGLAAANQLGLTTQNPMRPELSTPGVAAPKSAAGMTVHTRRPAGRAALGTQDAAVLEVLRDRGVTSDLSPTETVGRLSRLIGNPERYLRLASAAASEPPRVRAMLGALGEDAGAPADAVRELRASLNPLSRFDFGVFGVLPNAGQWQAK